MTRPTRLLPADAAALSVLMQQFHSAAALTQWGGEGFSYPIRRQQFLNRLQLKDTRGFQLQDLQGQLLGYGQLCDRFDYHHLARLFILPRYRGQGLAAALITALMRQGLRQQPQRDISLFVFADNLPALRCYQRLGFRSAPHPGEQRADLLFMQLPNLQARQLLLSRAQMPASRHANEH